jgi:hypothetical protein
MCRCNSEGRRESSDDTRESKGDTREASEEGRESRGSRAAPLAREPELRQCCGGVGEQDSLGLLSQGRIECESQVVYPSAD